MHKNISRLFLGIISAIVLMNGTALADGFTSFHSKIGNNGSVDCDIYCVSPAYDANDKFHGSCVAARIRDTGMYASCFQVHQGYMECLCATF